MTYPITCGYLGNYWNKDFIHRFHNTRSGQWLHGWGMLLFSLAQLISGKESAGAVNAFWLAAIASGLWRLSTAMEGAIPARWMSIAAFISLPITAALSAGMKTELQTTALLIWLFALVAGSRDQRLRFWITLAVLAGGLAANKTIGGAMATIPLAWALFRHPLPSFPKTLLVIFIALIVAGSSYIYAWVIAGNPILPLYNAWFESPYFRPENFLDKRWKTGFGPGLFWGISFETNRYLESYPGAGGFLQIILSGVLISTLYCRKTRIAALLAVMVFLLPLIPLQYLRYAYPGMAVIAAILVTEAFKINVRHATWVIIAMCILHLAFQANSSWMIRNGILKEIIVAAGEDKPIFRKYTPERLIASQIRQFEKATDNVLLLSQPYAAEYGLRGRMINWHSPTLAASARAANQDQTGQAWVKFFRDENIRHVVFNAKDLKPAQAEALKAVNATQRTVIGGTQWWTLPEE